MDYQQTLRATLLLLLALTATGCGNKGDLFLLDHPPAEQQSEDDSSEEDGNSEG